MNLYAFLVSGAASTLLAFQGAPPAPPAPSVPPPPGSTRMMLSWTPGEVRCEGHLVTPARARRPLNQLSWRSDREVPEKTLRFEIDPSGRTLSIEMDGARDYLAADLAPTLAATRFAAGAARKSCRISYAAQMRPLTEVPVADLISYTVSPMSGPLPKEGWDRIGENTGCANYPRKTSLVRVMPDFLALPGTKGITDWSMVEYDIDAAGRPTGLRVTATTGNQALDAASLKAMKASRFTGGARSGCRYPYWRVPETLAAPPLPEEAAFRSAEATCPSPRSWVRPPTLRFPANYDRRRIEGWAVVRYDIAPWGEIGNLKVLASQPTEDFGTQAIQVIQSATVAPRPQGASGCIDRVKFVMGPHGMRPDDPDAAARLY